MDVLLYAKAVVQGLVEGATEFIPVSSTGHLILVGDWIRFQGAFPGEPMAAETFEIFIQLGAILAVVWFYRSTLMNTVRHWIDNPVERRFLWNLFVAFLPAAIVGLALHDFIKDHLFNPLTVAGALVVGGLIILLIEWWAPRAQVESVADMRPKTALEIGLAQILALFPGVSRSGATIMGAMSVGVSRVAATEFSFFLAIPVMFAATLYDLFKSRHFLHVGDAPVFAVGFVVAFLSALVVVKWLIHYVAHHDFKGFAYYRIAFGVLVLAYYWYTGQLHGF